jgi:tetratricopeptide (TPR) repeat protein
LLQTKQDAAARASLRGTLAIDSTLVPAHMLLAQALVSADSARSAEAEYQKAIEIDPKNASAFRGLGYCQIQRGAYAEDTARVIDSEVKRLIESAESEARRILTERRGILDTLSGRLLVKEVIEGEELRELMGPVPVTQQLTG